MQHTIPYTLLRRLVACLCECQVRAVTSSKATGMREMPTIPSTRREKFRCTTGRVPKKKIAGTLGGSCVALRTRSSAPTLPENAYGKGMSRGDAVIAANKNTVLVTVNGGLISLDDLKVRKTPLFEAFLY